MRGQQLRKCMVPHGKLNLLDWKMLPGVFQFFVSFHPSLLFMAHLINLVRYFLLFALHFNGKIAIILFCVFQW